MPRFHVPRFNVRITGDDLERAMAALNASGIPTIASFPAYFVEQGPPEGWRLDRLMAVVDAPTANRAEELVWQALPAAGGYRVEPAEPA